MPTYTAGQSLDSSYGLAGFTVQNDWGGGFTGQVTITNTTGAAVNGWEVVITTADKLTGNWDSNLVSQGNNTYVLSNASWNASLAAGGSTTLGFNFDQASDDAAFSVALVQIGSATLTTPAPGSSGSGTGNSGSSGTGSSGTGSSGSTGSTTTTTTTTPVASTPGASAVLTVLNDWGSGFTGQVTVTNTGSTAISGWQVEMDTLGHMTGEWNSSLVSQGSGAYVISNDANNGTLAAGASTTFGFNMDRASNPAISVGVSALTTAAGTTSVAGSTGSGSTGSGSTGSGSTGSGSGTGSGGSGTTTTAPTTGSGTTGSGSTGSGGTTTGGTGTSSGSGTSTGTTGSTPASTATASLAVTNDWGSGFTGQITVTNTGTTALSGWQVALNTAGHVTGNWNSALVSQGNGVTVLSNDGNDGTIAPGASVTLGFNMDRAANSSAISVGVNQLTGAAGTTVVTTAPTTGGSTGTGTTTGTTGTGGSTGTGTTTTGTMPTTAVPGHFQYLGVNLSGAEFGIYDPTDGAYNIGTYGTDYTYPTHAEIDYYASEGMNVIRLPFSWERLQTSLDGQLDKTQLGYIDDVVHYAATKGVTVLLDPHNYGYGYGNLIGSTGTPDEAYANLWSQLATHYASQSNVMFGLMNEPHVQSPQAWVEPTNDAIAAIRAAGATQEITVAGTDWTGGDSWVTSGNAQIFAPQVVDPLHNMAFEIHQYSDADGSGSSTAVVSTTIGAERLQAVTQWAEATGNKLFLGEFGAGQDTASLTNMQNMLNYMAQHNDVWQGATEWGGGPWWGNYGFATDPQNGVTTPQIALLSQYAPTHTT